MLCVSDPVVLTTTLGIFSLALLRWESLPQDLKFSQDVLVWISKNVALYCKSRYNHSLNINTNIDCTGHFPRPPRTQPFTYEEKLIPEIQTTPIIDEDKNDTPDDNGLEYDEMDETDNKEDCGDDENNNKKEEELNQKNENKNMIED